MERLRQKARKDKPKYGDKEKPPLFVTDVKTIKENLKIKEILRTVKMNSSMRVKAPRGSKVMQNKDFNDNEDFEDVSNLGQEEESTSAINPVLTNDIVEVTNSNCVNNESATIGRSNSEGSLAILPSVTIDSHETPQETADQADTPKVNGEKEKDESIMKIPEIKTTLVDECPKIISRERKLSLDQTMWMRRQSLSQSEIDLHSIGKSPLERKSSFFRKKMDSFLKNTSAIFKKQSVSRSQSELGRRGSMSMSLQSLNDKTGVDNTSSETINQGSATSLQSSTAGQSTCSLVTSQDDRLSPLPGDQESMASLTTEEMFTGSANSLNDAYSAQGLLNSRAVSVSSGLDTAVKRRKRKTSWANRVTWLASETMTNYLKRVIPDDHTKNMHACHSYQDLSSIPENQYQQTDSKGRRLSYQRAVSGEDPVLPTRYSESSLRRRHGIPEDSEADCELSNLLAEYSEHGVPALRGFHVAYIPEDAFACLQLAEKPENLEEILEGKKLPPNEEARQAVVRELVATEADYIKHLMAIVEVFIATAHALQDAGKLLDVDTEKLFSNIPDVLNASLYFWEITLYPMVADALMTRGPFNTELMASGFCRFRDLFIPYEKYVGEQTKALDYLRSLSSNSDFMTYLSWCHRHKTCNRLQLADILVKPMQRLTKYSLILRRIITHTDSEPERTTLMAMESFSKNYVLDVNRAIRQKEEIERLEAFANSLDPYELEFKDEEIDKYFKMYSQTHLRNPMVNSLPGHSRSIVFQGDLRFKDNINTKEIEVHVVLLTDMILICKKQSKGNPLKLIRPKYMIDRVLHFPRLNRNKEIGSLIFIVVDDVGSSTFGFSLSESGITSKTDPPTPPPSLKIWELKVREARLSYDLGVWFAKNPSRDLSEVEMDSSSEYAISAGSGPKPSSEDINIDREARERVAAMLHRSIGASTEYDFSQASLTTDSFDGTRTSGAPSLRHPMQRNSTGGSSRNSRLSSFQQSTSAASHDEPGQPAAHRLKAAGSVEASAAATQEEPKGVVSAITVNVLSESESETMVPAQQITPASPSKLNPRLSAMNSSHSPGHGSGYGLGTGPTHSPGHSPIHVPSHMITHGGLSGHIQSSAHPHIGYSAGHAPAHIPAHGSLSAGHTPGHTSSQGGLSAGHTPGHTHAQAGHAQAGHSAGHTSGHVPPQAGHSAGHTPSPLQAGPAQAGHSSGSTPGHVPPQAGHAQAGHSSGSTPGHVPPQAGHNAGHSPGHTNIQAGHSACHSPGQTPAHSITASQAPVQGGHSASVSPGHSAAQGGLSAGHSPAHGGLTVAHTPAHVPAHGGLSAGHTPGHSPGTGSHNTLQVQPQNTMTLVHSLPDLTIDPSPPRPHPVASVQSASDKLYQSHQELLQRNRLSASHHHQYLSPDHRGTSYPPPSPTRASLKRGLAFSYSFKNPPLSKMGHVNSQSQLQAEAGPSTSQQSPAKSERSPSPMPEPTPGPSTSSDKGQKNEKSEKSEKGKEKKKHFASRNKSGGSTTPKKDKEEKGD